MSLDSDPQMQFIYLMHLRRDLMYVKYHILGLKNLQPLVDEVEKRYKEAIEKRPTGE